MGERGAIAGAVVVAVTGAGIAWGVLASEAGCQLQGACDPATYDGFVTDTGAPTAMGFYGATWQSGPIEGTWAWFPGQRTYRIVPLLPDGGALAGPYTFPQVLLSADPRPWPTAGSNFAQSAGNTAEFSSLDSGTIGFQVTNNTCSPYYLWLQVAPEGQAAGAVPALPEDGGADGAVPEDGSADGAVQSGD